MSRDVPEWVGKDDNEAIPPRVRARVFLRFGGVCQECTVKISGKRWICDHRVAIINGGANRENNLGPIHEACDKTKTAADVAEKSDVARKRLKFLGIAPKKGRPMPGSKASGLRKRMNGEVERR